MVTQTPWLISKHSFSFGDHYDPRNTHHGLLMVQNEDVVAPDAGYDTHPHRDMEILTWVLDGALSHHDSLGNSGVIYPGLAQRLSAGSGIRHSERNESTTQPVHFVQMWVIPDQPGGDPSYQQADIADALRAGELVTIASGIPGLDGALTLGNRSAALHGARLPDAAGVTLPTAPYVQLSVTRGQVRVGPVGDLYAGDAIRFTASGGQRVTAIGAAEVLVWEMHTALGATERSPTTPPIEV